MTVTGISPSSGSSAGGTSVMITGTGFVAGDIVKIGGNAAMCVVKSATSISAIVPPGIVGTADVSVTNDSGEVILAGGFVYTRAIVYKTEMDIGIYDAGQPLTIIRKDGNIETFGVQDMVGVDTAKGRVDPLTDYEFALKLPSDCGVKSGDLLLIGEDYFLVMASGAKMNFANISHYRTKLYRCNSIFTVYGFADGRPTVLLASGIRALISQASVRGFPDDMSNTIPRYYGKSQPFLLIAQADSGIKKECVLVDQASRRYRLDAGQDVFLADNILQALILWENV